MHERIYRLIRISFLQEITDSDLLEMCVHLNTVVDCGLIIFVNQ